MLLAASSAHAEDAVCHADLGRGWPPATENYGSAVEQLFAAGAAPALSLTFLPKRGAESGLQLIAGAGDGDWTLRYSEADERVDVWSGGRRELRIAQQPEVEEAPMPAALARRVVEQWRRALEGLVPGDRTARFHEGETLLFVADDLRVSGLRPDCGQGERLMRQAKLMIEAAGEDEEDRAELWHRLSGSLDELEQPLAGGAG